MNTPPWINAASSCSIYLNDILKKHIAIIAMITAGDLSEPDTNAFECNSSDVGKAYLT